MSSKESPVPTNCQFSNVIYWKDPIHSAICCFSGLTVLFILKNFTLLGLICYSLFYVTTICSAWVLLKNVIAAFQVNQGQEPVVQPHPFKSIIEALSSYHISNQKAQNFAENFSNKVNSNLQTLVDLLFVKSWTSSVIFACVLYFTRPIFVHFQLIQLVFFGWLGLFSLPLIYYKKKEEIDSLKDKAWEPIKPHYSKLLELMAKYKPIAKAE